MSRFLRCLSGLAVVVLLARPGAAQAPSPTAFQITVEDEVGGVLVGAKVTLTAVATQQTRPAPTSINSGRFICFSLSGLRSFPAQHETSLELTN